MAAPGTGNWKKSDAAQFDFAGAARRKAERKRGRKPDKPAFSAIEKLGSRGGRSGAVARRVQRQTVDQPEPRRRSGFSSVAALAGGGLNKREEAFAKSQGGVIKSRFGGDVQKALAAMRREAGRQRIKSRQATSR